jgi:hypothetical protein
MITQKQEFEKILLKFPVSCSCQAKLFKELLELCPKQKTPKEKLNFQRHLAFQQMHQKCLEYEIAKAIERIENDDFDWEEINDDDDQ